MFKKQATEELDITEWDPPFFSVTECQSCCCYDTTPIEGRIEDDGSEVELSMDAQPLDFIARVMIKFMCGLMKGQCAKAAAAGLDDVERFISSQAATAVSQVDQG